MDYVDKFTSNIRPYPYRKAGVTPDFVTSSRSFASIGRTVLDFSNLGILQQKSAQNSFVTPQKRITDRRNITIDEVKPLSLNFPLDAREKINELISTRRKIEGDYGGVSELRSPAKTRQVVPEVAGSHKRL